MDHEIGKCTDKSTVEIVTESVSRRPKMTQPDTVTEEQRKGKCMAYVFAHADSSI